MTASGSWAVVIDNVSRISGWWSDALCKAVTGDGWVQRKLYTDSDLAVLAFRRCIVLTSIDAGAMRGDLGDRLMLVDLEGIPEERRRTEAELDATYESARPRLLAGLLSAVSRTLAALPDVKLDAMPRMADFGRVLAALDTACPELTGGRALDLYMGQRERIAGDVVDADPVASAVLQLMEGRETWAGTAGELLTSITPAGDNGKPRPPKGWPGSPRGMAGRLLRIVPALRAVRLDVDYDRENTRARTRTYTIRKKADSTVRTVQPSQDRPSEPQNSDSSADGCGRSDEQDGATVRRDRPIEKLDSDPSGPIADGSDGSDGRAPDTSGRVKVRV